ncbi:hypothetical protein MUN84_01255 [Hymenobacter sp. 5516J-16]|uniref:hypothetical protein n=1 Tax=Hymenobacter sp. 5516J-16 TaxID=2932253 RepID=UPI001FD49BF9|nr:hypothetical protein [Hymenobacter sp. 5516J-16]UOQ77375.1 hypothetical protein MUN84_01255 [Hymenobacter sp. 5516J-16]
MLRKKSRRGFRRLPHRHQAVALEVGQGPKAARATAQQFLKLQAGYLPEGALGRAHLRKPQRCWSGCRVRIERVVTGKANRVEETNNGKRCQQT